MKETNEVTNEDIIRDEMEKLAGEVIGVVWAETLARMPSSI